MSDFIKPVATPNAASPAGHYSQGMIAGDSLYVAGHVARDPTTGEFIGGSIQDQTARVLESIEAVITAAEESEGLEPLGLKRVVDVQAFLVDMNDAPGMNEIYVRMFGDHKPSRATVAVAALPKGAKLEMKCTAYLGPSVESER
ncbi:MAG: Rid family hydrolase [Nanoarchaeota archaeon]